MIEQVLLALYKHLSGKQDATLEEVAEVLKGLGFSMEEVKGANPFDVLRTAEILRRLKAIEQALLPDFNGLKWTNIPDPYIPGIQDSGTVTYPPTTVTTCSEAVWSTSSDNTVLGSSNLSGISAIFDRGDLSTLLYVGEA